MIKTKKIHIAPLNWYPYCGTELVAYAYLDFRVHTWDPTTMNGEKWPEFARYDQAARDRVCAVLDMIEGYGESAGYLPPRPVPQPPPGASAPNPQGT